MIISSYSELVYQLQLKYEAEMANEKNIPTLNLNNYDELQAIKRLKAFIRYNYTGIIKILLKENDSLYNEIINICKNKLKKQIKKIIKEEDGYLIYINK